MVKRCLFCGRYFTPDYRVKDRQKSCGRPECKKARKKKAQEAWTEKNPGYFQGRYPYVKAWRARKMIQDEIPTKKPYVELVIRIPAKKKDMIQDEIVLKRVAPRTFAAHGYG
jgi:CDP-diacylglycerol pyrophosphatase